MVWCRTARRRKRFTDDFKHELVEIKNKNWKAVARNEYIYIFLIAGTGRSVPSTPLQVSPQGEQIGSEGNAEVAQSIEVQISESQTAGKHLTKNL